MVMSVKIWAYKNSFTGKWSVKTFMTMNEIEWAAEDGHEVRGPAIGEDMDDALAKMGLKC